MNTNFSLMQTKPVSAIVRFFCVLFFPLFLLQNCYYNPVVYDLLNPIIEGDEKAGLFPGELLLALGRQPGSFAISGIIRNGSGTAQTNKAFTIISSESTEEGLDTSGTTDSSGRFFIQIGQGNTTIHVTDAGEDLVMFTLNLNSSGFVSVNAVDPPEYEIGGLIAYDPANKPLLFEVISTTPSNNDTYTGFNPDLIITFSDSLPEWDFSTLTTLISNNILVSPSSLTLGSPYLTPPYSIGVMTNFATYDIEYTIQIGPGFYSASGVPLTPHTFKFRIEAPL